MLRFRRKWAGHSNVLKLTPYILIFLFLMQSSASSATFRFTIENTNGNTPGTISGLIVLPDGDGAFEPASIIIDLAPASLGYSVPIDALSGASSSLNIFTVANGEIDVNFSTFVNSGIGGVQGSTLSLQPGMTFLSPVGLGSVVAGVSANFASFERQAVVPVPTSLVLLLSGLLGLLMGKINGARRLQAGESACVP